MNEKSISERIKTKYMRENKNLLVKHYIFGVIYISIEREKKKKRIFFFFAEQLDLNLRS